MKRDDITEWTKLGWSYLNSGLKWWFSELSFLVPESLKKLFAGNKEIFVIEITSNNVAVQHFSNDNLSDVRDLNINDIESSEALEEHNNAPALVMLNSKDIFIDQFKLPEAARSRLRQAMVYETERRNPFNTEDTLFDYAVVGQDKAAGTIDIEWAIAPKSTVLKAQAVAQQLGFHPLAAGVKGNQPATLKYVFDRKKSALPFSLQQPAVFIIAALVFMFVVFAMTVLSRMEDDANLVNAIATAKTNAQGAEITKANAIKLQSALYYIAEEEKETKPYEILLEVTKALPDDSWVSEFDLNGNQLRLTGHSTSASSLIEKLASHKLFINPHFQSAITPEIITQSDKKTERFDILMAIRDRHSKRTIE